jgi:hypothetical protein
MVGLARKIDCRQIEIANPTQAEETVEKERGIGLFPVGMGRAAAIYLRPLGWCDTDHKATVRRIQASVRHSEGTMVGSRYRLHGPRDCIP